MLTLAAAVLGVARVALVAVPVFGADEPDRSPRALARYTGRRSGNQMGYGGPRRAVRVLVCSGGSMRLRTGAALAFACAALLVVPATGSAASGRPKPVWLTSSLQQKIKAAGAQGM